MHSAAPSDDLPPEGGVRLRSLLTESAIYGLGSIADKLIGFLLLPITTALLAPEDFGVLSLFGVATTLAFLLASLGQPSVVPILHAQAALPDERRRIFGAATAIGVGLSLLLIAATIVFGPWSGAAIFGPDAWKLIYIVGPFTLVDVLRRLAQTRLRLQERPRTFVALNLVATVVIRALALGLVAAGFGVFGWATGEMIGIAAAVALMWPLAFRGVSLPVDRRIAAAMIPLGLALTPSLLAHWVMMGADRFVMLSLPDAHRQIGLYAIGERISTIMQLVNAAFVLGWQRFAFENLARPDGEKRFAHGLTLYAVIGGYVAFGLSLLGDDLTRFITPSSYNAGVVVIPTLTLAGFLGGFGELVSARLMQAGLGVRLSIATWIAALVQVGLLFWAIPRYGILGAASASLIGQTIKLLLIAAAVHWSAPVPFELRRLVQLAIVFTTAYVVGGLVGPDGSLRQCLWQIAVAAATPFVVIAAGFMADDEKARIVAGMRRLLGLRTPPPVPLSQDRPQGLSDEHQTTS